MPALFRGRHFQPEIIATCVRWYLRFSLSLPEVEELMTESGLAVDHTTIWRWSQKYASRGLPAAERKAEIEKHDVAYG
jgi:transposase-like protein